MDRYRFGSQHFYAKLGKIRRTRTIHLSPDEITGLRKWLRQNTTRTWYVSVRDTKMSRTTGRKSVVVYLDDDELWPQFVLTWR